MKDYQIKTFLTWASGKNANTCADKIAINKEKLRYAVADGVSASYMPSVWAEILSETFINEDATPELFNKLLEEGLLDNLSAKWRERTEDIEQQAEGKLAMRYERAKELYGNAASTLAGVSIHDNAVHYYVVGDSCIFLIDKSILTVLSEVKSVDSFTNRPDYIASDNHIDGTPIVGSEKIPDGWIVLMTDAVAKWFWKKQVQESEFVMELWNISTQDEFESLILKERDDETMDNDDVAIVMIKVENEESDSEIAQEALEELESQSTLDKLLGLLSWLCSFRLLKRLLGKTD